MSKKIVNQGDKHTKDTLRWMNDMDAAFLDALLDECGKGNRVDGTFTTNAYDNVLAVMRSSFEGHIRKDHLKNRLKTLKDHFGVCYDLFHGLNGFSWNPLTKMFEAEHEVWEELVKAKPDAKRWMRTPIKFYDKLFEIYGTNRATEKHVVSAKEKVKRWDRSRERIDLNDDENLNSDAEWIDGHETPYSASHAMAYSPDFVVSTHSQGSRGTSKGTKHKAPINNLVEVEMERMSTDMQELTDVMRDGNRYYKRFVEIAEKQAEIAEKQLALLEKSKPRHYSENDVWSELEKLGVVPELHMACYRFLCRDERAKREFFGVPSEVRLRTLYELMKEGGAL